MQNILQGIIDSVSGHPGVFLKFREVIVRSFSCEREVILAESGFGEVRNVLDFSCGVGQYSTLFASKFYIGVDIDMKYISYAKKHYNGEFLFMGKGSHLAIKEAVIDLILAIDVFHHLSEIEGDFALREFRRVLKRSGKIIIMDILPSESQSNLLAKLLIKLDKGYYAREMNEFAEMVSKYFDIEKHYSTRSGPYTRQVLVLTEGVMSL